jgi:arylsulfatase
VLIAGTLKFGEPRPQISVDRDKYMYYPGTQAVPGNAAAKLLNRAHSVTAEVEIPAGGAEGVLFSMGGNDGGFSFYVKDKKLRYAYNYVAQDHFYVGASDPVPEGHHFLSFDFAPTGKADPGKGKGTPATVRLLVDGKEVARGDLPVTIPLQLGLGSGAAVGADPGSPTTPEYRPPFKFTGRERQCSAVPNDRSYLN